MHLLPIALAIMLITIVVLLIVLLILFARNYRRYGSVMPRAQARPLPHASTLPAAAPPAARPAPVTPPAAVTSAAAYLEQNDNGGAPQIFVLDRPVTVIGRDLACDIRIDERFVTISRRHAQIVREAHDFVLSDLNSSSGVYVDGARIGRNRVRDGAVIRIGQEVQFTFHQAPARGVS